MRSGSFSQYIKLYSFMFMHNISTTVVYVNGKYQANAVIRRITCNYLSAFVSSCMHRNVAFRSVLLPETIITSLSGWNSSGPYIYFLSQIYFRMFLLVLCMRMYLQLWMECFDFTRKYFIRLWIRIPHDLTTLTRYERIFKYSDIKPRG